MAIPPKNSAGIQNNQGQKALRKVEAKLKQSRQKFYARNLPEVQGIPVIPDDFKVFDLLPARCSHNRFHYARLRKRVRTFTWDVHTSHWVGRFRCALRLSYIDA